MLRQKVQSFESGQLDRAKWKLLLDRQLEPYELVIDATGATNLYQRGRHERINGGHTKLDYEEATTLPRMEKLSFLSVSLTFSIAVSILTNVLVVSGLPDLLSMVGLRVRAPSQLWYIEYQVRNQARKSR